MQLVRLPTLITAPLTAFCLPERVSRMRPGIRKRALAFTNRPTAAIPGHCSRPRSGPLPAFRRAPGQMALTHVVHFSAARSDEWFAFRHTRTFSTLARREGAVVSAWERR